MKIAILSCNTGGGHNAAAAALAEELAARGHESKTYNTLDFLPKGAADLISRGHDFAYRYTPKLYGAGYRREEKRPSPLLYENSIRGIGPLYEALMDLGADAAICVHVFPAMMMTELRCSYGLRMPAWFVATDFTCSPGVGELQLDGICIPHPALTPEFEAAGLPRERLYATGIPIRRQFCRMPDRAAARRQLSLDNCRHVFTLACGSMGAGPLRSTAACIAGLLGHDDMLVAVCGSNQRMHRQMIDDFVDNPRVRVLGFTDQMCAYMQASDLLISKAGGLTTAEAVASRTPLLYLNAVPGCESRNIGFMTGRGYALAVENDEELTPLLSKLRSQQRQIQRQMRDLKRRQEEFTAITENMSEGFLVIDQETRVLTYNSAVLRLLYAQVPTEEGESVYALNREAGFRRCVEEALAGRRCEQLLEKDDDCRQIIASPVEQDGQIAGAVLVILDVTEKEQRERLRREFTANVSHELKTPLTSILGTAEILQNGLVKPEDVPHFAGNIHRETERLIGLVNDIIKLSRLDEGGGLGQWETVDLYEEARAVLEQLAPAAQRKQVTTRLQGGEALVRGVPQIVEEIVYNLCDNAIAYNRANGSVTVTVENTAFGPRITVADTGIGIPREAQGRVFERFYRVDKSHSSGGTGLGLSIVKHGAAYLGAQVELHSEPGHGSTFTLTFPKAGA